MLRPYRCRVKTISGHSYIGVASHQSSSASNLEAQSTMKGYFRSTVFLVKPPSSKLSTSNAFSTRRF